MIFALIEYPQVTFPGKWGGIRDLAQSSELFLIYNILMIFILLTKFLGSCLILSVFPLNLYVILPSFHIAIFVISSIAFLAVGMTSDL